MSENLSLSTMFTFLLMSCIVCCTIAADDSAALINSSDGALLVGTIFILESFLLSL